MHSDAPTVELTDIPLDLIGQAIARDSVDAYIQRYELSRG